jgi:hypothetical protein
MYNFLKFLKESGIIQGLLNIEQVEDIIQKIVPAVSAAEHQFYGQQDKMIHKIYASLGKPEQLYVCDPKFCFYEVQLCLGRIALEINKDDKEKLKEPAACVDEFFQNHLYIRRNEDIDKVKLSDMGATMPMLQQLKASYEEEARNKGKSSSSLG